MVSEPGRIMNLGILQSLILGHVVKRARLYPPRRVLPVSCHGFTWNMGERHVFECYRRTDTQRKGSP